MPEWLEVCASVALCDGGDGVRFSVGAADQPAFVVRTDGNVHAYLNRCGHVPVELDWPEGRFFDADARYIQCSTHGAIYHAASGACLGGPCAGRGLVSLECAERDGAVWVRNT